MTLKQTALYDQHLIHKGKMVDFGGWNMPVNYGSQIKEHEIVRTQAGMFDVSHMFVIDVEGVDAQAFLQKLLANDVAKLKTIGKALYSGMLNENGGVIDDLIVYHLEGFYRVVVNCATAQSDLAWMEKQSQGFDVSLSPKPNMALIAVQGPKAIELASQINGLSTIKDLSIFQGAFFEHYFVARTGYTGEDGVEIILDQSGAVALWQSLLDLGVKPCGLGARDTLRLEAGMNLYGNDMSVDVSPLEANMGWTVDLKNPDRDFIGRSTLEKTPATKELIGLVLLDKGVMRSHQVIEDTSGNVVGEITSGTYSPTLQQSIAMARVTKESGNELNVVVRDKRLKAKVVTMGFVRNGKAIYKDK